MKAGSSLRRYFEGRLDLTDEQFTQILRSHYKGPPHRPPRHFPTNFRQISDKFPTFSDIFRHFRELRKNVGVAWGEGGGPIVTPICLSAAKAGFLKV